MRFVQAGDPSRAVRYRYGTGTVRYPTVRYFNICLFVDASVTYAAVTDLAGEFHVWKYPQWICFVIFGLMEPV